MTTSTGSGQAKNFKLAEVLQFYADNDLNEIVSEKSQNRFAASAAATSEREMESMTPSLLSFPTQHKDMNVKTKSQTPSLDSNETLSPDPRLRGDDKVESSNDKTKSPFNPFLSTSDAISILAKKTQSDEKFSSLNDIVTQAKTAAKQAKNLQELREAVQNFDGCNLKKMATNTVFSDGNPDAKVMVIGEAPGNNEDLQGIPFCGDSGKLLDEMLRSVNLTRKDSSAKNSFYITNVIFWRPPGNRKPTPEELAICRPFVERHIQLINPEVIVLVGATSMEALLGPGQTISTIRGKFMDFAPKFLSKPIKTFAIFHPSYLLRQPGKKRVAWLDMLMLEKFLQTI